MNLRKKRRISNFYSTYSYPGIRSIESALGFALYFFYTKQCSVVWSACNKKAKLQRSDVPRTFLTKERRSENVVDNSSHASTTKTMFVCAKFAQNKGKTLCSLLVFTQLFRTRNKERSIFRLVYLGF